MEKDKFVKKLPNVENFSTIQFTNINDKNDKSYKKKDNNTIKKISVDLRKAINQFNSKIETIKTEERIKKKSQQVENNEMLKTDSLNCILTDRQKINRSEMNFRQNLNSFSSYKNSLSNMKSSPVFTPSKRKIKGESLFERKNITKNETNYLRYNVLPYCASTFYSYLNQQQISAPFRYSDSKSHEKKELKNNNEINVREKNKLLANFREIKLIDNSPVVFPVAKIPNREFHTESEKRRFERSMQLFLNLKYIVENDQKNSSQYIIKFLLKNGYKKKIDSSTDIFKINCFENFLREFPEVDYSLPLLDIMDSALNFKKSHISITNENQTTIQENPQKIKKKSKKKKVHDFDILTDLLNSKTYLSKPQPVFMNLSKNNEIQSFLGSDIKSIRKKNKLLEYIIWKRSKNSQFIDSEKSR